jgi:carbon storage regulator
MLILTRKSGESVMVGNSVRITVTEISPGTVRLGFEAPSEVSIYREEVYHEIALANRAAAERTLAAAVPSEGPARRRR